MQNETLEFLTKKKEMRYDWLLSDMKDLIALVEEQGWTQENETLVRLLNRDIQICTSIDHLYSIETDKQNDLTY